MPRRAQASHCVGRGHGARNDGRNIGPRPRSHAGWYPASCRAHQARRASGRRSTATHDVLICGASFAGLAVARELAGSGADVLIVDRYEIGERQTSACGIPTEWLRALGLMESERQRFDYAGRCTPPTATPASACPGPSPPSTTASSAQLLWRDCDAALRDRQGQRPGASRPDRERRDRGRDRPRRRLRPAGRRRARLAADAGRGDGYQPPDAPLSRGLEVHPGGESRGPRDLDRPPLRARRLRLVLPGPRRAADRHRLLRPPLPRQGHDRAARRGPRRASAIRYQGNWIPHKLRRATEGGVFFVGDSAGHCLPLSAEGIRTALYFGIALGRELRGVVEGRQSREQAAATLRRLPRLARVEVPLDAAGAAAGPAGAAAAAGGRRIRLMGTKRFVDWSFGHYLRIAPAAASSPPAQPRERSAERACRTASGRSGRSRPAAGRRRRRGPVSGDLVEAEEPEPVDHDRGGELAGDRRRGDPAGADRR